MQAILKFLTYLLAIYGALMLILSIFGAIHARLKMKGSKVKLVLVVKNTGEYIEFIIKDLIRRILIDRSIPVERLTVVDMDSDDETAAIVGKLAKDYDFIELLSEKEKEKAFSNF